MSTRKIGHIILGFIISLAFVILISKVEAQQTIDMMSCGDRTVTPVVVSNELTIRGVEKSGINIDNHTNKAFNNMTFHFVGLSKNASKQMTGTFYSKYMDPSGDLFVVEISQIGMEVDWKFLYGTGKWKGITGGGKASGNPPGEFDVCERITGTYELKK
ncbi:MAG: hypothetical protein HY787_26215 [Deltaproteobacteria bacterium]|nr:hypothetical protein [Deltaproteobacteria bacterium]